MTIFCCEAPMTEGNHRLSLVSISKNTTSCSDIKFSRRPTSSSIFATSWLMRKIYLLLGSESITSKNEKLTNQLTNLMENIHKLFHRYIFDFFILLLTHCCCIDEVLEWGLDWSTNLSVWTHCIPCFFSIISNCSKSEVALILVPWPYNL